MFSFINCFSTIVCIINGDSFYPNPLLPSRYPFHHSSSPSLHLPMLRDTEMAMSNDKRDCGRSVILLPPLAGHALLALTVCVHMMGDYGRPLKHPVDKIICALWAMYRHQKTRFGHIAASPSRQYVEIKVSIDASFQTRVILESGFIIVFCFVCWSVTTMCAYLMCILLCMNPVVCWFLAVDNMHVTRLLKFVLAPAKPQAP